MSDDLVDLAQGQENIRHAAASYGVTDNPGLAVVLAQSGASAEQIRAIGGFADALDLSTKVANARQSGVQLDLTDSDRAKLAAVGTPFGDVDKQQNAPQQAAPEHRGFLGTLSHLVNDVPQLQGVKQVFHFFDRAADVTNELYRGGGEAFANPAGFAQDFGKDLSERTRDMQAGGYNPQSVVSQFAFMSRGKQVFSNMDDLRQQFSPEQVDLAQRYLIDPEGFVGAGLSDDELAKRQSLLQDQKFQGLVKEVDSRHISPGRDIARGLGIKPGQQVDLSGLGPFGGLLSHKKVDLFNAVSGGLDAAWSFAADPTLAAGHAVKGARAVRYGLKDLNDKGRIVDLMENNSTVKKNLTQFLDNAHIMRAASEEGASAEAKAAAARAYSWIHNMVPEMEPMLDEVYGGGLRGGRPIESYDDLVSHMSGGTALLRLRNGIAASETPLMPGATPRIGLSALKANMAGKLPFIDLEKKASDFIASKADAVNANGVDVTGLDAKAITSEQLGQAALKYRRTWKGRLATTAARVSTLLPEHSTIDLTSAAGAEDIRRFAALYMPRSHANLLAARYSVASVGERRAIAEGVYDQTMHAAGIPSSVSGASWKAYQDERRALLENSAYDSSGKGLDKIAGTAGETERREALHEGQTNTDFYLPNVAEMRRFSAKVSVYDWTMRSALESKAMDTALGALRTSWLVSPSSAVRNAMENVISAHIRGASADEIARSRAALSSVIARRAADRAGDLAEREVDNLDLLKQLPEPTSLGEKAGRVADRAGIGIRSVYHGRLISGMKRAESALGRSTADSELVKRAQELVEDEMGGDLHELTAITGLATRGDARDVDDMVSAIDRGYKVKEVGWKNAGYQLDSADGMGGARYWSQQLATRFNTGRAAHFALKAAVGDEGDGIRLFRGHVPGAVEPNAAARAQGVYFHVADRPDYVSPFEGGGRESMHAVSELPESKILRPSVGEVREDGMGHSAGTAALEQLAGKKEFARLAAMPEDAIKAEIKSKFGVDVGDLSSYESPDQLVLEAYGAQLAKKHGYSAIVQKDGRHTEFVALDDAAFRRTGGLNAREELINHLLSPEYATARAKLERFSTLRDGTRVGTDDVTDPMMHRAASELAADQIEDIRALVTGRNGKLVQPVVDHLLKYGRAPKAKDLGEIADELRPAQVIQPKFVPDLDAGTAGTARNVVQALGDAAYNVAVARPLAWMSSLPIYHANYVKAYRRVESVVRAHNPGFTEEELNAHVRDVARQHAMDLTTQMIDNPRVRSQMALITRNVFNFWRAQEDFMRRWGRNLKENPAALREMQLAVEAGMHTGLVHKDDQGNLVFSYPGSGAAIQGVGKSLAAFGLSQFQGLGVVPNMTTQMQFLNAGLDRPFLPSTSPVASIPLRVLSHFNQDQVKLVQAKEISEGTIGASRSWWAQFLPSPVYRFMQATSSDDREGQYASAVRNAMLNLTAAGHAPGPDATPDEIDAFKKRVQIGVRNQLTARAVLALFLPGAPSAPTEETDASKNSELEAKAFNTTSLKSEFSRYVNQYGYQRALSLWTKTHPDDLVYTVGTTEGAGGVGGNVAPTDEVLNWMKANPDLVKNFPMLAAYFAPQGPGDFSQDAWQTELELGLRQHKDLDTFYRDIATKGAETKYYQFRDARDKAVAVALGNGDNEQAALIKQGFSDWVTTFKAANPLLMEKWNESGQNKTIIAELVKEVGKLSASPLAKQVDPHGDLALIVNEYNAKKQYDDTHTARTVEEKAQQDAVNTAHLQYVAQRLERSPQLIPLYQGVFDRVE